MESKYKNPKILDVDIVYPKENDEYSVACTELPTLGKFRNIIRICSIFAKEWEKLPNVYLFFSEFKDTASSLHAIILGIHGKSKKPVKFGRCNCMDAMRAILSV